MEKPSKAKQARSLMYNKSMLEDFNYYTISEQLNEMQEACDDIRWAYDDDESLIDAFDGDDEEAQEFKLLFSDLSYEIERLVEGWNEIDRYDNKAEDLFNDIVVSMIGAWFPLLGFDSFRGDYFRFDYPDYESPLAVEEAQKRIMRKTKKELFDNIGRVFAILLKYSDICSRYDHLRSTVSIFEDDNLAAVKLIKRIDEKYKTLFNNECGKLNIYSDDCKEYERMINILPNKCWVE